MYALLHVEKLYNLFLIPIILMYDKKVDLLSPCLTNHYVSN